MVAEAAALPSAFHAHQRLLHQSGRALVCAAHSTPTAPGRTPQCPSPQGCHPGLYCSHQRAPHALRMDKDRRRNLGQCRPILSADFRDRTLDRGGITRCGRDFSMRHRGDVSPMRRIREVRMTFPGEMVQLKLPPQNRNLMSRAEFHHQSQTSRGNLAGGYDDDGDVETAKNGGQISARSENTHGSDLMIDELRIVIKKAYGTQPEPLIFRQLTQNAFAASSGSIDQDRKST